MNNAQPTSSSAAASSHGAATPALELLEARQFRDALKDLLRKEQAAMADFLEALADFDRDRGWEPLGHASLFAFLHFELGLSNSAAFHRMSAARLIQRIPELLEPIASGRLCLSTTAELAKVVTDGNWTEVAPRFFGLSAREARDVVAELRPRAAPPLRAVVTSLAPPHPALGSPQATPKPTPPARQASWPDPSTCSPSRASFDTDPQSLLTSEEDLTHPVRGLPPRDAVEPLTAELRRLHVTVSRQLLKKIEAAQAGLGHAIPGATMEQVLEAALDLLFEKQARARGLVRKPRSRLPDAASTGTAAASSGATSTPAAPPHPEHHAEERADHPGPHGAEPREASRPLGLVPMGPHSPRRTGPREAIPAAVRRAAWERDGGRCSWPLDGGGCCGSTNRLELDHIVPWAEGGPSTVVNLRVVCGRHNALAAQQVFGRRCVGRYAPGA